MCGLCGIITSQEILSREVSIFQDLLTVGQRRGLDSTGVALYDEKTEEVSLAKALGVPFQLFQRYPGLLDSTKFLKEKTVKWLMGHNRKATRGEVNGENAHPFHHGNIVGSHNGTLPFRSENILKSSFLKDMENDLHGVTDSEMLFMAMSKGNSLETLFKAKVAGDYALTWFDAISSKYFIYRNSKRPLSFMRSKDKKTLFYSSEVSFLATALQSSWMKHLTTFDEAEEFQEDHLYSVDFSGDQLELVKKKIASPPIETYAYAPPHQTYSHGRNYPLASKSKVAFTISDAAEFYKKTKHRCKCGKSVYYTDYEDGILDYDAAKGIVYCGDEGCKREKK